MPNSPQENAVGFDIIVNAEMSLLDATVHDIILKSPTGVVRTLPGTFVNDGSDGLIKYTTVDGDLVPHGVWQAQSRVVTPAIDTRGKVALFDVWKNLA